MTPIFLFPGQSSRYPEMIERLYGWAGLDARWAIAEASEGLGRDLRAHYRRTTPPLRHQPRRAAGGVPCQPRPHLALERARVRADYSLGLSLGEYNHLVHIGALRFTDALRLVNARGAAYDAGPAGVMASVFPLSLEELEQVVARARNHGALEIVNLNSPPRTSSRAPRRRGCRLRNPGRGARRRMPHHRAAHPHARLDVLAGGGGASPRARARAIPRPAPSLPAQCSGAL